MERLEVGHIDRTHGVRGDLLVTLTTNRTERVDPGSVLYADDEALEVERSRPHQDRFIVHFVGIDTKELADTYRGKAVWAEPIDDPDEIWIHELLDATVVDTDGAILGTIAAIEANPASDLMILDNEGIVPFTFFVERDDQGRVVVDPPDGLFDL